jgi:hypothetical protein
MNDTPPEVEARLRELFMQRTASDRVRMVSEMFDLARALVIAGIKAEWPDITPSELRVKIFERTYGDDLDADTRARTIGRLRGRARSAQS